MGAKGKPQPHRFERHPGGPMFDKLCHEGAIVDIVREMEIHKAKSIFVLLQFRHIVLFPQEWGDMDEGGEEGDELHFRKIQNSKLFYFDPVEKKKSFLLFGNFRENRFFEIKKNECWDVFHGLVCANSLTNDPLVI